MGRPRVATARGSGKRLSNEQKAEVMVRKDIGGKDNTSNAIAKDLGCSQSLIDKMRLDNLSAQAIELYEQKKANLKHLAISTTEVALIKSKELIEKADKPRHLSGIAAAGRFADTVMRLETEQPTEITKNISSETHVLEFYSILVAKVGPTVAIDELKRASLAPLVSDQRKEEIVERIIRGEIGPFTEI